MTRAALMMIGDDYFEVCQQKLNIVHFIKEDNYTYKKKTLYSQ